MEIRGNSGLNTEDNESFPGQVQTDWLRGRKRTLKKEKKLLSLARILYQESWSYLTSVLLVYIGNTPNFAL